MGRVVFDKSGAEVGWAKTPRPVRATVRYRSPTPPAPATAHDTTVRRMDSTALVASYHEAQQQAKKIKGGDPKLVGAVAAWANALRAEIAKRERDRPENVRKSSTTPLAERVQGARAAMQPIQRGVSREQARKLLDEMRGTK